MAQRSARPLRFLALAALLAALLAVGQIAFARLRARLDGPAAGACWIWHPGGLDDGAPIAFYAFGEVELAELPERARLVLTADEDYRLHLNGEWIGSGRYRAGAGLDAYPVADRLRLGRNRVLVELRSSRGAGGLLLALLADEDRPLVVSDRSWRVVGRYQPALVEADRPVLGVEAPRVWGVPPSGRWRAGRRPVQRPVWFPASGAVDPLVPVEGRVADSSKGWRRMPPRRPELPQTLRGDRLVFDWGREVTGVPVLDLRQGTPAPSVLRLAADPEALNRSPADGPLVLVLPIDGEPFWRGGAPVRFRYLEVRGTALRRRPFVLPVADGVAAVPAQEAGTGRPGVFGLDSPWRPARAEKAILDRVRRGR